MKLGAITTALSMAASAVFAADKTLDIGVSDALKGGAAVYGLPQANAVKLAAEEINASGGIQVATTPICSTSLPMTTRPTRPRPPIRCAN